MFSSKTIRQLAAYSVSIPAFAAPPSLAKETVYMPSRLAALVLGRGPVSGVVIRDSRTGEKTTDASPPTSSAQE